jgi:sugar O-acyltransferase (sialic acid O-acetyltransferase NeuD family)
MGAHRQRVVVVGAGGHGHVVVDVLRAAARGGLMLSVVAVVDDSAPLHGTTIAGAVVAGGVGALESIPHDAIVIAIGDNGSRRRVQEALASRGEVVVWAFHPSAVISPEAVVEAGAVVCAGAIVGPAARVGAGAIVNTGARVDHHCTIGAFAHVAPGSTLGGAVSVGAEALVGIGASVLPGVRIGVGARVGAGAVVLSDVADGQTVVGVPARAATSIA